MKIYELGIDDMTNWEWRAILPKKEDERFDVIKKFNTDIPLSMNEDDFITMMLINGQSEKEERKEIAFQSDLIYWTNDIMLDADSPTNGCVVSKRLLNLLTSFNLPKYYYYPIKLINTETKETNREYFLLQIFTSIVNITDFSKSHYRYVRRRSNEILKEEIGSFDSYESYSKAYDTSFFENRVRIDISKRALKVDYDIVWSVINYLRVKENVKDSILESSFRGIKISSFSDFEIILP